MDSEIIVNLISRSQKDTIEERIMESMNRIQGAYSLVLMTKDTLYGVRDPYGFRPLCIGRTDEGGWVLASETCALDAIGAKFVRDVQPGEFVQINEKGVKSTIFAKHRASRSVPLNTFISPVRTASSTARTSTRPA